MGARQGYHHCEQLPEPRPARGENVLKSPPFFGFRLLSTFACRALPALWVFLFVRRPRFRSGCHFEVGGRQISSLLMLRRALEVAGFSDRCFPSAGTSVWDLLIGDSGQSNLVSSRCRVQ